MVFPYMHSFNYIHLPIYNNTHNISHNKYIMHFTPECNKGDSQKFCKTKKVISFFYKEASYILHLYSQIFLFPCFTK